MTICEAGDVVVVPFPFSDMAIAKPRPAVVLSARSANAVGGTTLLAMITTASGATREDDTPLSDLDSAGLRTPSMLRLKLFTIDNRLIARRIGQLSVSDRKAVRRAVTAFIAI